MFWHVRRWSFTTKYQVTIIFLTFHDNFNTLRYLSQLFWQLFEILSLSSPQGVYSDYLHLLVPPFLVHQQFLTYLRDYLVKILYEVKTPGPLGYKDKSDILKEIFCWRKGENWYFWWFFFFSNLLKSKYVLYLSRA